MARIAVVFPAPFGPTKPVSASGPSHEGAGVERHQLAEPLGGLVELQHDYLPASLREAGQIR